MSAEVRVAELERALADLLDLVTAWQSGPLMNGIVWDVYPPAQTEAIRVLGRR